jgi:hypothetical protein
MNKRLFDLLKLKSHKISEGGFRISDFTSACKSIGSKILTHIKIWTLNLKIHKTLKYNSFRNLKVTFRNRLSLFSAICDKKISLEWGTTTNISEQPSIKPFYQTL